ncbi:hypothetical protein TRFO_12911 [Tritrichomonas foetus]|uniref:Uncharacterized protein n=1 Tax=Tritrichomonas foetus TaxID=1144522 RepID=A0A1J4L035_9EUKA|nr:hypothetical protein TRFO_12911 [Tritrichomonas foetus]|eukprot:OHT16827.1 hypothetical protein TRFO_12911 [Tritrichomonas foetus]
MFKSFVQTSWAKELSKEVFEGDTQSLNSFIDKIPLPILDETLIMITFLFNEVINCHIERMEIIASAIALLNRKLISHGQTKLLIDFLSQGIENKCFLCYLKKQYQINITGIDGYKVADIPFCDIIAETIRKDDCKKLKSLYDEQPIDFLQKRDFGYHMYYLEKGSYFQLSKNTKSTQCYFFILETCRKNRIDVPDAIIKNKISQYKLHTDEFSQKFNLDFISYQTWYVLHPFTMDYLNAFPSKVNHCIKWRDTSANLLYIAVSANDLEFVRVIVQNNMSVCINCGYSYRYYFCDGEHTFKILLFLYDVLYYI